MSLDLFSRLAKTITIPAKSKTDHLFNTPEVEKMTAIDCMSIISTNAVSFQDQKDFMIINGVRIPKDGYSDGARLQLFIKKAVNEEFRNALLPPGLKNQKWGELPFDQAYLFKQDFDKASEKKLAKVKVCTAESVKIWGGACQVNADTVEKMPVKVDGKYVEQGDFETIITPVTSDYYHNYTIKPRDVRAFLSCQTNMDDWAERECAPEDNCVETSRHVHLVSARYMDKWVAIDEDGAKIEIDIAPPIHLVTAPLALKVTKNCVLQKIKDAQQKHKQALLAAGSVDGDSGPVVKEATEEDLEKGAFHGKVYATAMDAGKELAAGDYDDLQAVVRHAGNIPWRRLEKIAPTSSSQQKMKKDLGAIFTTHIMPTIQKTGGSTMKQVLAECFKQAIKFGTRRDTVFGYFLSRLAEPINGIKTIDGKLQLVAVCFDNAITQVETTPTDTDMKFWFDD